MDDFELKIKRIYEELLAKKSLANQFGNSNAENDIFKMFTVSEEYWKLQGELLAYSKIMYEYNKFKKQKE